MYPEQTKSCCFFPAPEALEQRVQFMALRLRDSGYSYKHNPDLQVNNTGAIDHKFEMMKMMLNHVGKGKK